MKSARILLAFLILLMGLNVAAQQLPPSGTEPVNKTTKKKPGKKAAKASNPSKLSIMGGLGASSYVGDLVGDNTTFGQLSYASSLGLSYSIIPHLNARIEIGLNQVQGYDSKKGGAHPERNLSFKSKIFEFSVVAEYTVLDMNKHKASPYLFAGIGAFNFNPRAFYGPGGTYALRELGTEGQGLAGYPGLYSTIAVELPFGFGFKYAINKRIMLLAELNYRLTGTDYLDDVSKFYPDKTLLDAKNPNTSKFTFRGNGTYPNNPLFKRGNNSNNDGYYTTQLKIAYNFQSKKKKDPSKTDVPLQVKNNEADRDGDGIADALDRCPDIKGSKANTGCPFPFVEGADLAAVSTDSMTYRIYFDVDRSLLLSEAFKTLQAIVATLKADNTLGVNITGHSDNLGTAGFNLQLSSERANITRDYFISYNIPVEKITTSYYGESKPVDVAQQWRNRRVEVTILKK